MSKWIDARSTIPFDEREILGSDGSHIFMCRLHGHYYRNFKWKVYGCSKKWDFEDIKFWRELPEPPEDE